MSSHNDLEKAIEDQRRKEKIMSENASWAMKLIDGTKPKTYKLKLSCFNCGHSGYETEIPWGVWACKHPTPCPKCGCSPEGGGLPR